MALSEISQSAQVTLAFDQPMVIPEIAKKRLLSSNETAKPKVDLHSIISFKF
jgi:hypothetical protein